MWYVDEYVHSTTIATVVWHATGPEHDRIVRESSWIVWLPHGPSGILCWTVRPYINPRHIRSDRLGITPNHLAWSRTVRPLTPNRLGMHTQNTELHNMHNFVTHHDNTTTAHCHHIITMSRLIIQTWPNVRKMDPGHLAK
jgi:hypothetical protein